MWGQNAPDANGLHGVQASLAVGDLNGVNGVVAPSLVLPRLRRLLVEPRAAPQVSGARRVLCFEAEELRA